MLVLGEWDDLSVIQTKFSLAAKPYKSKKGAGVWRGV